MAATLFKLSNATRHIRHKNVKSNHNYVITKEPHSGISTILIIACPSFLFTSKYQEKQQEIRQCVVTTDFATIRLWPLHFPPAHAAPLDLYPLPKLDPIRPRQMPSQQGPFTRAQHTNRSAKGTSPPCLQGLVFSVLKWPACLNKVYMYVCMYVIVEKAQ